MKYKSFNLLLLFHIILQFSISADWKYLGKMKMEYKEYDAFYDAANLHKKGNKFAIVFVNLIDPIDIENNLKINNKELSSFADKLIDDYYIPPYILFKPDTTEVINHLKKVTIYEVLMNIYKANSKYEIVFLIDYINKKTKISSTTFYEGGGARVIYGANDNIWDHIMPNTFMDIMFKVVGKQFN